ncbi:MAG: TetR/AcrR family transcriptional regulator [Bacteroidetes bacterium]|nr:TetR/AcrR family transcriptional regulator [Bacteroidota bacterium]
MGKEIDILLQSRTLIFKYGIKSLTMDEISQQLGMSKKTLYQFYENKADLIKKIVSFSIKEQIDEICAMDNRVQNPIEELLIIYQHNSLMAKQMNPSMMFEMRKYYPESYTLMEEFRTNFIYKSILENLERGIQKKLYRPEMDVKVIAKIYTSRVLEIFNPELFPPMEFPASKVLKEMFIYHIRGISTAKGLAELEKLVIEI